MYNPVFWASTIAIKLFEADGATARAVLPMGFAGKPLVSSFQVFPASVLFQIPLPGPPEEKE